MCLFTKHSQIAIVQLRPWRLGVLAFGSLGVRDVPVMLRQKFCLSSGFLTMFIPAIFRIFNFRFTVIQCADKQPSCLKCEVIS